MRLLDGHSYPQDPIIIRQIMLFEIETFWFIVIKVIILPWDEPFLMFQNEQSQWLSGPQLYIKRRVPQYASSMRIHQILVCYIE